MNNEFSEEYICIDEPKYKSEIFGKIFWLPRIPFRPQLDGTGYYLILCENSCCEIKVPARTTDTLKSALLKNPGLDLNCRIREKNGKFKESWLKQCEEERKEAWLHDPKIPLQVKLDYVDNREPIFPDDPEMEQMIKDMEKESLMFEDSL